MGVEISLSLPNCLRLHQGGESRHEGGVVQYVVYLNHRCQSFNKALCLFQDTFFAAHRSNPATVGSYIPRIKFSKAVFEMGSQIHPRGIRIAIDVSPKAIRDRRRAR